MKHLFTVFAASLFLVACNAPEKTEEVTTDATEETATETTKTKEEAPRKSPNQQATGTIDGVNITIDYCSPYVKSRTIWGDLVPFNKIWRAGANETTAITIDKTALINGDTIQPGTYGFFMIPEEDKPWTIVLNEEWNKKTHGIWGTYNYKEDKDVTRSEVTPEWTNDVVESLDYSVNENGFTLVWEKAKVNIPVTAL
ncbi:DUF2911 domain-containing protein [Crocinitomix catalasitica]|uniref:DUF2911 domain-containing protein n=1 Tax=Crocinitomix catalasitica TaxID=184607 RepID=UPI000687356E|nr:DUF2911 domain-containing protein [Crocinitomix catalasitica]